MIPSGRFPTAILWMDVPPELIDVNIHPTKQEVRFSQTSWIQTLVGKALGQALKSHIPKPIGQEKGFHHQGAGNRDQVNPSFLKNHRSLTI